MGDNIKIIRGNAAIDAAILTKDQVTDWATEYFSCKLEQIAAIGDDSTDLSLLEKEGLGLVGAPANSQQCVIDTVRNLNGYVSSKRAFEGFIDFYKKAMEEKIRLIISDKDGVLKEGGDMHWGPEFAKLALEMGQDKRPYVAVLTGSSCKQNISFRKEYGLDERLETNSFVKEHPYLLLVENGAIHINVLTREIRNYVDEICPELLKVLKGEFETQVRDLLESKVLQKMGLGWTDKYEDQQGKVYHIKDKISMVSFNVPRSFLNGKPYRKSNESERFRNMVVETMEKVADKLKLPYKVL